MACSRTAASVGLHQGVDGRPFHVLGRVAEDAVDRGALVADDAVRVDHRHDVGAVLDEGDEPLAGSR